MKKELRLKLAELIRDNPDVNIKCKVDEECGDGEHGWMMCEASNPRLSSYWTYREDSIFFDEDEDDLIDIIQDDLNDGMYCENVPDPEGYKEEAEKIIASLPKAKCILIEVCP